MLKNIRSKIKNCDPINSSDAIELMSYMATNVSNFLHLLTAFVQNSGTG